MSLSAFKIKDNIIVPGNITGSGTINITGVSTLNSTTWGNSASYTYGTGSASNHRTALGLGTLATLNNAPAGTLTGATLNSTVTGSSLTSVGTLAALTVSGVSTLTGGIRIPTQSSYFGAGTYGTVSETAGGLAYITGNNIKASTTTINQVEKLTSGANAAQFIRMRYDQGISLHTGVGAASAAGTNFADDVNSRLIVNLIGNVGIGNTSPTEKLDVTGNVKVSGHFSAVTKSFLIDHPTKEDKKLQYGVVESNQHSVLVRGRTAKNVIELPEEWSGLVHENSITVQLTPVGTYQKLFVILQDNEKVVVGGSNGLYNYTIYGERKDVDRLQTEI